MDVSFKRLILASHFYTINAVLKYKLLFFIPDHTDNFM